MTHNGDGDAPLPAVLGQLREPCSQPGLRTDVSRLLAERRAKLAEGDLLVLGQRYLPVDVTLADVAPVEHPRREGIGGESIEQELTDVLRGGSLVEVAEDNHPVTTGLRLGCEAVG